MPEDLILMDFRHHKKGWLSNFKKRKQIKEHYKSGEAASAPLDDLPAFRTELKLLIAQYDLNDVYNADETGLYWKLEPNKSLSSGPLIGTKKPKDRVTIMLACNVTGTHKLPAVFIHRYKNPKCIRNIDKNTLPVWYYWNNVSWMQRSLFQSWIKQHGTEIPTLNILNAIDWVTESWKNVTEDVIYRCWKRTGILLDELEDINDEQLDDEIEIENEIVQSLIDQMVVDNTIVKAEDYIKIDNILETNDILNDDEIIAAIQEAPENEEEDKDESEALMISNKVALE
ncbi:4178_t:CDS:2, partial [Acaulospora morrowiae]